MCVCVYCRGITFSYINSIINYDECVMRLSNYRTLDDDHANEIEWYDVCGCGLALSHSWCITLAWWRTVWAIVVMIKNLTIAHSILRWYMIFIKSSLSAVFAGKNTPQATCNQYIGYTKSENRQKHCHHYFRPFQTCTHSSLIGAHTHIAQSTV